MYSGTTFSQKSGRVMGVHQRVDRLARRNLESRLTGKRWFPQSKEIIHFEGLNGPDGIKRKSPSVDEPWHYIDPQNPADKQLIDIIENHIKNLSKALQQKNRERASFEAAWLAHAVCDGLTPAHHDNLSIKVEQLWGKPHDERNSVRDKLIIKGNGPIDTIKKNWLYWGSDGIFTLHWQFEWGIAVALSSIRFKAETGANGNDIVRLEKEGFTALFYESLHKVAALKMYETFAQTGWTRDLAVQTKEVLIPEIVKAIALAWYQAVYNAEKNRAS